MSSQAHSRSDDPLDWATIDSARDLQYLDRLAIWEDSQVMEYYARFGHERFFPNDVCRSGHEFRNLHILCHASPTTSVGWVELVFIQCEFIVFDFFDNLFFRGHVDSLKRVELLDWRGSTVLRCARLIYRICPSSADISLGFLARKYTVIDEEAC